MRILYGLWIWNMAIFQMLQSMNVMWYVLLRRIGYLESKQIKKKFGMKSEKGVCTRDGRKTRII